MVWASRLVFVHPLMPRALTPIRHSPALPRLASQPIHGPVGIPSPLSRFASDDASSGSAACTRGGQDGLPPDYAAKKRCGLGWKYICVLLVAISANAMFEFFNYMSWVMSLVPDASHRHNASCSHPSSLSTRRVPVTPCDCDGLHAYHVIEEIVSHVNQLPLSLLNAAQNKPMVRDPARRRHPPLTAARSSSSSRMGRLSTGTSSTVIIS
jgi:hypothetical protein